VIAGPRPRSRPEQRVDPLGTERYRVQFTADRAWLDKLEYARALLSHRVHDGDVAQVLTTRASTLDAEIFHATLLRCSPG